MSRVATTRCYIEEYEAEPGKLSARLREKITGRKVDLGNIADPRQKQHFIEFLSAARRHTDAMPDVFSRDGNADSVMVSGDVDFDAPDEVRYFYNENLSYLFA